MPRKRDPNKFRRGREQKYLHVVRPASSRSIDFRMPMGYMLVLLLASSFFVFTLLYRPTFSPPPFSIDLTWQLPKVQVNLPTITLPSFSIPRISVPQIQVPNINLPEVTLPRLSLDMSGPVQRLGLFFSWLIANISSAIVTFVSVTWNILRTVSSWLIMAIQVFGRMVIMVAAFLNPLPVFKLMWQYQIRLGLILFRGIMTIVITILQIVWTIINFVFNVLKTIVTAISNLLSYIGAIFQSLHEKIKPVYLFVFASIGDSIKYLVDGMHNLVNLGNYLLELQRKNN